MLPDMYLFNQLIFSAIIRVDNNFFIWKNYCFLYIFENIITYSRYFVIQIISIKNAMFYGRLLLNRISDINT